MPRGQDVVCDARALSGQDVWNRCWLALAEEAGIP